LDATDILHLERAVELAERGRGCTHPNPVVGAVLVRQGRVLAEGYHAGPGLDHAEVVALKQVPDAQGSTVYVTLEPCCNYGRTPPCTDALIRAGVARVVVGAVDPSPAVNGRGAAQLRQAGIVVDIAEGDIALRCKRQNNGFRKAVATGLPFVLYKYAMTLDGRVACDSGDARWVSGAESRAMVHSLRARCDAVMVGAGTLRADDPLLTAREVGCKRQPLRVVVDPGLSITSASALVRSVGEGPVLAVCGADTPPGRRLEVESWGVEVTAVEQEAPGRLAPRAVASLLGAREVQDLLLEGGPTLAGSWWSAGLIDQVMAFVAPRVSSGVSLRSPLVGEGACAMTESVVLREVTVERLGDDVCVSGYVTEPF
jgi:diaminohydroxyphosphoribosylaminopyrimidine deaminase/5-amino-6-(5-phosphoribosylamino)uracil reductase